MLVDTLLHDAVTALEGAAATAVVWRSQGRIQVTVIAKATFAFAQGGDMARAAPQPVVREEVHHGKNPARSVRLTSDLVPHLSRADVVFTGHAHAPPGGGPVTSAQARLGVFSGSRAILDKTVQVQDSAGFERVPVVFERAYGGFDFPDNPVGTGAGAESAPPTLIDPQDPRRPAGLGPIGRAWPARKRLLKSTPRKALERSIAEIPDDFDWTYFQAAPPDQRTDPLRGDEWIVMDALHPTLARAQMRLPGARGLARIHGLEVFGWSEGHPLTLTADTLRIDGDEQTCTVVWRVSFPVAGEAALAALRIAAGVEIAGETLAWPATAAPLSPAHKAGPGAAAEAPRTAFLMPEAARVAEEQAATPFTAGAAPGSVAHSARPVVRAASTGTVAVGMDPEPHAPLDATLAFADDEAPPSKPSLPFQEASAPSPFAQPSAPSAPRERGLSDTLALPSDDPSPEAPVPAIPAPPPTAAAAPEPQSHWAPPPEAPPRAPEPPPPPKPTAPAASPTLKKGLYGRFGGG